MNIDNKQENKHVGYIPVNLRILNTLSNQLPSTPLINGKEFESMEIIVRCNSMNHTPLRVEFELSDDFGIYRGVAYRRNEELPKGMRGFEFCKD